MKSEDVKKEIQRLQIMITKSQSRLQELRNELETVMIQETKRWLYINSREIIDTMEKYSGNTVDMSTIKRWSDKGYLGQVFNERELFWALDVGSGKQRNIYDRKTVMHFLHDRGYVKPRFDVLDWVVLLSCPNRPFATVIRYRLDAEGFIYTVQRDDTFEIVEKVKEHELKAGAMDGFHHNQEHSR